MIRTEEKTIGDMVFHVTTFPATTGLLIKYRLLELLGPMLESLKVDSKDILEAKVTPSAMGAVIIALTKKLPPESFVSLVKELTGKTVVTVEGETPKLLDKNNFDIVFSDNYDSLYELVAFILEVNYRSFFDKIRIGWEKLGKKPTKTETPSAV